MFTLTPSISSKRFHLLVYAAVAALTLLGFSGLSQAAQVSTSLAPSASVANGCVIDSSDNIAFGVYNPISAVPAQSSGQIRLVCTKNTVVSALPVSGGTTMTGSGGSLTYTLNADGGMSKPWGQPTFVTTSVSNSDSSLQYGLFSSVLKDAAAQSWLANPVNANTPFFVEQSQSGTLTVIPFIKMSSSGSCAGTTGCVYARNLYFYPGLSTPGQSTPISSYMTLAEISSSPYNFSGAYKAFQSFILPQDTNYYTHSGNFYNIKVLQGDQQVLTAVATSSKTMLSLPYYAQVPAGQDVPPGTYQDTVVFQVSF